MVLPKYIPSYTVEDYRQWKGDWELWSGIPIAMIPSPKQAHQRISGNLHFQLRTALAAAGCKDCEVFYELDWVVAEDTVFRPDLLVVCGHQQSEFIEERPGLVVEILSESSRQRDLLYKRESYEKLGVPFYLVVDPEESECRLLVNGDSGFKENRSPELSLTDSCVIRLDYSKILNASPP